MKKRGDPPEEHLESEYTFDYAAAKPNRFAEGAARAPVVVILDDDLAAVFETAESVKAVLRALVAAMPKRKRAEAQP